MDMNALFGFLGGFSVALMAFTMLSPVAIAMVRCRAEKREQKKHAENTGYSLS